MVKSSVIPSNTMYMGDESSYRNFQGLLEKQREKIKEEKMESDPEFWTLWGHKFGS